MMYLHSKKSNGFRSAECGSNSTKWSYPMTYCWNVSRMHCWTFDASSGKSFRRSLVELHIISVWCTPTEKSSMFSDQLNVEAIQQNDRIRWLIAGICLECTVGHLIPPAEGHSGDHSKANPLENWILLSLKVPSIRSKYPVNMHS